MTSASRSIKSTFHACNESRASARSASPRAARLAGHSVGRVAMYCARISEVLLRRCLARASGSAAACAGSLGEPTVSIQDERRLTTVAPAATGSVTNTPKPPYGTRFTVMPAWSIPDAERTLSSVCAAATRKSSCAAVCEPGRRPTLEAIASSLIRSCHARIATTMLHAKRMDCCAIA